MTYIDTILAIEAIKQLKARYFQCVDCKDWRGFLEVFAVDAEFDHSRSFEAVDPITGESRVYGKPELLAHIDTSGWKMTGRDQLAKGSDEFTAVSTVHHGYNPQITLLSADEATGIWAMRDILRFAEGNPITEIRGYGHYHERYRRIEGRWVIQSNVLTRIRIDVW